MKDFLKLLKRYALPYKASMIWAVILNILSAVFNIFSFTLIIPILQILFKMDTTVYEFIPWDSAMPQKDILMNNIYYYITVMIDTRGPSNTLLLLGVFLGVMTLLKTSCYFGSSAVMIPLRTGIVRDIRTQVYNKVISLPLAFFSQQRKNHCYALNDRRRNAQCDHAVSSFQKKRRGEQS
jgi:ATP-binding cassette subfamily B protein/subfamily B ATP-binding cassette protein MsbA